MYMYIYIHIHILCTHMEQMPAKIIKHVSASAGRQVPYLDAAPWHHSGGANSVPLPEDGRVEMI